MEVIPVGRLSWLLVGVFLFINQLGTGGSTFIVSSRDSDDDEAVLHRNRRDAIEIPTNYSAYSIPPTTSGGPLSVKMSVVIMNVRDIREIGEEISVELNIRIYWKDPRLSNFVQHLVDSPSNSKEAEFVLLPPSLVKSIWSPDLFIDHVKRIEHPTILKQTASLRMYPDYTLRYSERLTITIACPMDFHFYPADTQRCHFEVKSYAYSDNKMLLAWRDKNGAAFGEDPNLSNFFVGLDNPNTFIQNTHSGKTYSGLRFTVLLTRNLSYHLIQTYLPSIILVIVSWLSFLINSDSVPGRMTLLMTCLLTLIAMFSAVRQSTPNVSYVKFIDFWMVVCVFFVFLSLMEFTLVLKIKTMKFKKKETPVPRETLGSGRGSVTPVYYPNPVPGSLRRASNQKGPAIEEEEESEFVEYGTPWRHSTGTDFIANTFGDAIPRRASHGYAAGDHGPGIYARQPHKSYQNVKRAPPIPDPPSQTPVPPPPPPQPPGRTKNEEIIAKVELFASIIIPFTFFCFCSLYWPWLIISSKYFEER